MSEILITGGLGYIGSFTARKILKHIIYAYSSNLAKN